MIEFTWIVHGPVNGNDFYFPINVAWTWHSDNNKQKTSIVNYITDRRKIGISLLLLQGTQSVEECSSCLLKQTIIGLVQRRIILHSWHHPTNGLTGRKINSLLGNAAGEKACGPLPLYLELKWHFCFACTTPSSPWPPLIDSLQFLLTRHNQAFAFGKKWPQEN